MSAAAGRAQLAIIAGALSLVLAACSPGTSDSSLAPLPTSTAAATQGTWPPTTPRQTAAQPSGEPTVLSRQTERPADIPTVAEADQLDFVLRQAADAGLGCLPHNSGGLHLCRAELDVAEDSYSYLLVEAREGKVVNIEATGQSQYADDDPERTGVRYYSAVQRVVDTVDAIKWVLFDDDVAIIDDLATEDAVEGTWGAYLGTFDPAIGHYNFSATIGDYQPWVPANTFAHNTIGWRSALSAALGAECDSGSCLTPEGATVSWATNGADVVWVRITPGPDGDALAQYRGALAVLTPLLPAGQADQILGWVEGGATAPLETAGLLALASETDITISCQRHLPSSYPSWTLPGVLEAGEQLAAALADTSGGHDAWLAGLGPLTTPLGLETLGGLPDVAGHAGEFSAEDPDAGRTTPPRAGSMSELYVQAGHYRYDVGFVRVNGVWLADMVVPD